MKPNPKKPHKALAGAVAAGVGYAITELGLDLPPIAVILITSVCVGLATYFKKNPMVE